MQRPQWLSNDLMPISRQAMTCAIPFYVVNWGMRIDVTSQRMQIVCLAPMIQEANDKVWPWKYWESDFRSSKICNHPLINASWTPNDLIESVDQTPSCLDRSTQSRTIKTSYRRWTSDRPYRINIVIYFRKSSVTRQKIAEHRLHNN